MKTTILLLTAFLATSAMAGEVTYPVPRTSALKVSQKFDNMSRENVSVSAAVTGRSVNSDDATGKSLEVTLAGNSLGALTVECLYMVEAVAGSSNAGRQRILTAGQATTEQPRDSFQFQMQTLNQSSKIKGWFIRVVKNGAVVGVAGSSEKFTAMAGDPATVVLYGQR